MTDREEYERDLQQLEKATTEALLAAQSRALTREEILTVAYSAGVANNVYKELAR